MRPAAARTARAEAARRGRRIGVGDPRQNGRLRRARLRPDRPVHDRDQVEDRQLQDEHQEDDLDHCPAILGADRGRKSRKTAPRGRTLRPGRDAVATAVQTIEYVNVVVFGALAIVAFWLWLKGRGRPALWAALTFGAVGVVVLSGLVLPEKPANDAEEVAQRLDVALLVLFPYLLYRFTTTFERPPGGLERFLALMTAVLLVWTFALPDFPDEGEPQSPGFTAYLIAFLLHWTTLSIVAAVRLWRAGRDQPSVAKRRMRLLAAAATIITAAILLAGLSPGEESPLSLAIGLLVTASGLAFLLGLAPPPFLRLLWRRPETERVQTAIAGLMGAKTPDDVTASVLPPMLDIVGARAIELRDEQGTAVGSFTAPDARDLEQTEVLDLALPSGSLQVWTSRHAPYFGNEEFLLLRTLGALAQLALDRARLFGQEQDARRALEQADELKSNFVALAAHELRTPVAVIHGVIETIDRRGSEIAAGQKSELEETLRSQTTRLKMLVEQLLDLSRLDAHAVSIDPQRFPVRYRVEEIVRMAAGERAREVTVEVPSDLEATVDPSAFDRILSNLVTNALRYGKPPVTVYAEHSDGRLKVAVEDRGDGVSPEFVPSLFERFSRSESARPKGPGTGLGLAIALSYAEAHQGKLRYRQAVPHGARFEVVLPGEARTA
jgi:signal transduction histidine kinase